MASVVSLPCVVLTIVLLQWSGGAYSSEFGAHPDEPAHYVTGLMIRDYIAAGLPRNPMAFAQDYYDHYPKVALGNWPPGFYLIQSAWTLPFTPSRASVLLLMALLTAILAVLVIQTLIRLFGIAYALLGGLLFVAFPLVQQHSAMVMTEIPVALFSFLAILFWGRYLERERTTDSLLFALFASAAIMTKGSGMVLVMVPPLAVVFSRRFEVLKRPSFWYPVLIVGILCGPWTWAFRDVARNGWMESSLSLTYTRTALGHFPKALFLTINPIVGVFALIGLTVTLTAVWRRTAPALWAAAAALLLGVLIFHAIVPASLDRRHLVQALPSWAMFVVAGVAFVERQWLASRRGLRWLPYGVAVASLLQAVWLAPGKRYEGFGRVAEDLISGAENADAVLFISSDASGEGMFIAETAMRERRPGHVVRRSSKALTSQTWGGRDYRLSVDTEADLLAQLARERIQFIVVDDSIPDSLLRPHHQLLKLAVTNGGSFTLRGTYPVRRGNLLLPHGLSVYEAQPVAATNSPAPTLAPDAAELVPR
jgi:hypothetical protein